ncbi:MAG TPA: hypothetical protein VLF43_02700 [Candidatus Saccharimonadales bacterium]|nr:hypothetical protein [Candidatus Saccharimonadales bacterium]
MSLPLPIEGSPEGPQGYINAEWEMVDPTSAAAIGAVPVEKVVIMENNSAVDGSSGPRKGEEILQGEKIAPTAYGGDRAARDYTNWHEVTVDKAQRLYTDTQAVVADRMAQIRQEVADRMAQIQRETTARMAHIHEETAVRTARLQAENPTVYGTPGQHTTTRHDVV